MMTAQELVDRRAAEHDPTEPVIVASGITWRRGHVMKDDLPGKKYYEIWSYFGYDAAGELYHRTVDISEVVCVHMRTLDVSFEQGICKYMDAHKGDVPGSRIVTPQRIYAWLHEGESVSLPGNVEFRAVGISWRRVVEHYVDEKLCGSTKSP